MFEKVPFKKEHMMLLLEQKANQYLKPAFPDSLLETIQAKGYCVTGTMNGVPMVCGGIYEIWPGRGEIWTVFNENSKECFVPVFRGIRKFLDESPIPRIELSVPCEFEKGKRRARLLGFELEVERARKYLPGGVDCSLYARVK